MKRLSALAKKVWLAGHSPWGGFLWLFLCACQEETPSADFSERLVVEGWVRTDEGPYEANIRMLVPYPGSTAPRITNIENLHVEDLQGNMYPYRNLGMEEGMYVSEAHWQARMDSSYRLVMRRKDEQGQSIDYVSSYEKLSLAPRIEDPELEYRERHANPKLRVHALSLFFQDPPSTQNFYRWRILVNGQLREDIEGTVLVSDVGFDGSYREHNFLIPALEGGDVVSIELWSLSEAAYRFLLAIALQSAVEEGVPLVSVVGNMSASNGERVLGFFGAAGFAELEITVPPL